MSHLQEQGGDADNLAYDPWDALQDEGSVKRVGKSIDLKMVTVC